MFQSYQDIDVSILWLNRSNILKKISTVGITTIIVPEIAHQNSNKMAPRFLKYP